MPKERMDPLATPFIPSKAGGCFFTDGTYILAGYQKKKGTISGIGGARLPGESFVQTALRETVEELFDISTIQRKVLEDLEIYVPPRKILQNRSYSLLLYSFEDLEMILRILSNHRVRSKLFDTVPQTVSDLLFKRKVNPNAEISHLALLPCIESLEVCPLLLTDVKIILNKE